MISGFYQVKKHLLLLTGHFINHSPSSSYLLPLVGGFDFVSRSAALRYRTPMQSMLFFLACVCVVAE
jgi:hypothetical protein